MRNPQVPRRPALYLVTAETQQPFREIPSPHSIVPAEHVDLSQRVTIAAPVAKVSPVEIIHELAVEEISDAPHSQSYISAAVFVAYGVRRALPWFFSVAAGLSVGAVMIGSIASPEKLPNYMKGIFSNKAPAITTANTVARKDDSRVPAGIKLVFKPAPSTESAHLQALSNQGATSPDTFCRNQQALCSMAGFAWDVPVFGKGYQSSTLVQTGLTQVATNNDQPWANDVLMYQIDHGGDPVFVGKDWAEAVPDQKITDRVPQDTLIAATPVPERSLVGGYQMDVHKAGAGDKGRTVRTVKEEPDASGSLQLAKTFAPSPDGLVPVETTGSIKAPAPRTSVSATTDIHQPDTSANTKETNQPSDTASVSEQKKEIQAKAFPAT